MMNPLEKQILFSLAIIRTIGSRQRSADEQAHRIQKLNAQRLRLLQQSNAEEANLTTANKTRIALIQFLGRLAEKKIRREI